MLRRDEIEEGEARRTNASMGLIVILLLAIAGVILVRELRLKGQIEEVCELNQALLRPEP